MEECKGKQKSIVEKEVIINVQEEQIEKLNYECNNKNKKIEFFFFYKEEFLLRKFSKKKQYIYIIL